jgi:hypothetical protein
MSNDSANKNREILVNTTTSTTNRSSSMNSAPTTSLADYYKNVKKLSTSSQVNNFKARTFIFLVEAFKTTKI